MADEKFYDRGSSIVAEYREVFPDLTEEAATGSVNSMRALMLNGQKPADSLIDNDEDGSKAAKLEAIKARIQDDIDTDPSRRKAEGDEPEAAQEDEA